MHLRTVIGASFLVALSITTAHAGPRPSKDVARATAAAWLQALDRTPDPDPEVPPSADVIALTASSFHLAVRVDPFGQCAGDGASRAAIVPLLTCARAQLGEGDAPVPWSSKAWRALPSDLARPLRRIARTATLVLLDNHCNSGIDSRIAVAVTNEAGQPKVRAVVALRGLCGE